MAGNHKGGGVTNLLFAHVEKAMALMLVGLAGYLAYASLGAPRLEKAPQDLASQVQTATAAYDSATWDDAPADERNIAFPVASPNYLKDLPAEHYVAKRGLSRSVVPPTTDRTDPKLLAAEDVEGTAVTAIFAFESEEEQKARLLEERRKADLARKRQQEAQEKGEQGLLAEAGPTGQGLDETVDEKGRKRRPRGGSGPAEGVPTTGYERFKAYSVACVLAKAPILDQLKLYQDALQEARGYSETSDVPRYVGLFAERAEVTADDAELKWQPVMFGGVAGTQPRPALSEAYLLETIADWIPWPEPLADSRYEHPILTMPLPPLVQQNWGPEVVHSDAPLQVESDAKRSAEEAEASDAESAPATPAGDDAFASTGATTGGGEFGGRGAGRGLPGRGSEFGGYPGGRGGFGGQGEFGGEFGGGGGGYPSARGGGGSGRGASGAEYTIDPDVPFAMVRFWDFTVQPGRQYRYRVRLVLDDVNRDVDPRFLAPEVSARQKKSKERPMTEWSEPSSVISVPMAGDALVVGAKLPSGRGAYAEGTLDLLVQSYSIDEDRRAMKASLLRPARVGAVLNFTKDAEVVSPDGRYLVTIKGFPFRTGVTVCDFRGGEELPGKKTAPVSALMMDAGGRLFLHDELADKDAIDNYRAIYEGTGDAGAYPGGYGPAGGGEFGGEFAR